MADDGKAGDTGSENAGDKGQGPQTFSVATLPQELQTEPYFKGFEGKPVTEVFKSALEAHKMVGGSVRIPGEKAEQKDWDAFHAKLRPESPDKYGLKITDPEVAKVIPEQHVKAVQDLMWQAGVHPKQAEVIMKGYESITAGNIKTQQQAVAAAKASGEQAIRAKYGDKYDSKAILVNRVAKRFGGEDFITVMKDYGLNGDSRVFDTLLNIGVAMNEDSWVTGDAPSSFKSRDGAQKEVQEILNDKQSPYHNASHPRHKEVSDYVNSLRKIIYAPKEG